MVVQLGLWRFKLLGEGEVDIDFDGGRFGSGNEFPAMDGFFRGSGEHVVAAYGLGCRDASIGSYGCRDFDNPADLHAFGEFRVGGSDLLLDGPVIGCVQGERGVDRQGDYRQLQESGEDTPGLSLRELRFLA